MLAARRQSGEAGRAPGPQRAWHCWAYEAQRPRTHTAWPPAHGSPSPRLTSGGHCGLSPEQNSGKSQSPLDGRHCPPAGRSCGAREHRCGCWAGPPKRPFRPEPRRVSGGWLEGPVGAHLAVVTAEPVGRAPRPGPQLAADVVTAGVGAVLRAGGPRVGEGQA